MNTKISNFIKTTKGFIRKHSPEILTGIGVTGMITSTVLAVKATPKALELINDKKYDLGDELTVMETIKVAWKPYVPALVTGVVSASCIIGASTVNYKRNTALATAYAISESTLVRYRDKVIETIGEKKEKEVRDKVAQDEVSKNPVANTQVIIASKGNTLFRDSLSGRYFKSDMNSIDKAINEINRQINLQHYASLNDYYYEIGLDPVKTGSYMGWNIDDGSIVKCISSCITEDDQPCIVVDFNVAPRYDFDKFL